MDYMHLGENALTMLVTLIKGAIGGKVDKENGKGLSSNDFTTTEKNKLKNIAAEANKTVVEDNLTSVSKTNALSAAQGKALNDRIDGLEGNLGGLGYGDMMKNTYDSNNSGVVDNAEALGGNAPSYYAPASSVPTKTSQITNDSGYQTASQVESAISEKGFQTETQIDGKIAAAITRVYKPQGSVAFANLPALSSEKDGFVYNVTDDFTTTANFVEGAGKKYPAGTNVVIVSDDGTYKFDALAGIIDLSGYVKSDEIVDMTNEEVTTIWNSVTV